MRSGREQVSRWQGPGVLSVAHATDGVCAPWLHSKVITGHTNPDHDKTWWPQHAELAGSLLAVKDTPSYWR